MGTLGFISENQYWCSTAVNVQFAEKFNGNYSILKYQLILPFNLHHIGKLPAGYIIMYNVVRFVSPGGGAAAGVPVLGTRGRGDGAGAEGAPALAPAAQEGGHAAPVVSSHGLS